MRPEARLVQFLLDQQTIWHAQFPTLRGRTHELIVGYLSTKGRRGSAARQLYGATKEVFQIDDSTVRERIGDVQRLGYVTVDPPDDRITGRSILTPSPALLGRYTAYTHAVAVSLCTTARTLEPARDFTCAASLTERQQTLVHATLEAYTSAWLATADGLLEAALLSAARRLEARRRLMTTSYWTLMHRALEERYAMAQTGRDTGLLADEIAVAVLALNGQGVHTTREHIAALIDLGLFERRRDRGLRIALSPVACQRFHAMLATFVAELTDTAARLGESGAAAHHGEPLTEQTLRFSAPPVAADDDTVGGHRHHLAIVAPAEAARRIPLTATPLSLGRTAGNDVVLPDAAVSRTHCKVQLVAGRLMVTDTGSTNGTFVEGRRIADPTAVEAGETLKVGPFSLMLEIAGSAP